MWHSPIWHLLKNIGKRPYVFLIRLPGLGDLPRLGKSRAIARSKQLMERPTALSWSDPLDVFGAPEKIRTSDLTLRRRSLYPAELRALSCKNTTGHLPERVRKQGFAAVPDETEPFKDFR